MWRWQLSFKEKENPIHWLKLDPSLKGNEWCSAENIHKASHFKVISGKWHSPKRGNEKVERTQRCPHNKCNGSKVPTNSRQNLEGLPTISGWGPLLWNSSFFKAISSRKRMNSPSSIFTQTRRISELKKAGSKVRSSIFVYSTNTMKSQVNPIISAYPPTPLSPPLKLRL